MKRLLLLRHAKSSWANPALADHDRPLAARGTRDAEQMAKWFAREAPAVDAVLCSSALRARQTLELVQRAVPFRDPIRVLPELYLPSLQGLLAVIHALPDSLRSVLIVGHSPSLDALALTLARSGDAGALARLAEKFPTGSLCVIELPGNSFRDLPRASGRLRTLVIPRDLRREAVQPLAPSKAAPVELPPDARALEGARLAVDSAVEQVRANFSGAQTGENPDFVHQLRVGVRRLRVALRVFRDFVEPKERAALKRELSWLFRTLGPLREHQVFLRDLDAPLSQRGALPWRRRLLRREAALRANARRTLASDRCARLVRRLLVLQAGLVARSSASPPLRKFARAELARRLRRVRKLERAWERHADPETLHALRKEIKKLRYTAEFVETAFSRSKTQKFLRRVSDAQAVLGTLNDVEVGRDLLRRLAREAVRGPDATAARTGLDAALDATHAKARARLQRAVRALRKSEPFWSR